MAVGYYAGLKVAAFKHGLSLYLASYKVVALYLKSLGKISNIISSFGFRQSSLLWFRLLRLRLPQQPSRQQQPKLSLSKSLSSCPRAPMLLARRRTHASSAAIALPVGMGCPSTSTLYTWRSKTTSATCVLMRPHKRERSTGTSSCGTRRRTSGRAEQPTHRKSGRSDSRDIVPGTAALERKTILCLGIFWLSRCVGCFFLSSTWIAWSVELTLCASK